MRRTANAIFCCKDDNDLVSALRQSGYDVCISPDVADAIAHVDNGGAVLILADDYPANCTALAEDMVLAAKAKNARLYIEYPRYIATRAAAEPKTIVYERLVAHETENSPLEDGAILTLNGCWYREIELTSEAVLSLAKVAGYDRAVFGLPDERTTILGWLDRDKDILVSTSCLSNFIRGRYAPHIRWKQVWQTIFSLLGVNIAAFDWEQDVSIEAQDGEALSPDAPHDAWLRNVKWLSTYMIGRASPVTVVFEGIESAIDYSGRQRIRNIIRGDCMGESAMELANGYALTENPEYKALTESLIDSVFADGVFYHNNPNSSAYGLNNWFEHGEIFYGDDNARMLLGVLSARSVLNETKWDEKILRCAFANLRTSDKNGLRRPRLEMSSFADKDWTYYYNETTDYVSPHYQAYLWALFIWMYALTGVEELLTKSEKAISMVMERFPDKLRWQNSLTGEITRMLLPLSFLASVSPTDEHKAWLKRVVDKLLEYQQPCGAIRDAFGDLSLGKYRAPRSNDDYGTSEAPIIQQNGDAATDLLYTTNWALIGLWEASLVLKEAYVADAYALLRDFIIRIQLRSNTHPELDGAWMRSFDYRLWEYWGSSSDIGWGAWSVESGWVNTWLSTTLMLEERGESLLKLSAKDDLSKIADEIYRDMLTPRESYDDKPTNISGMPGSAE